MATMADLRARITRHRVRSEAAGVSLLALIVFVVLGVQARRALTPARTERAKLEAAAREITGFRAAFRASTPEEDLRVATLSDSLGVGVARDRRVALAHEIAASAEALELKDVRVRFASPDSAAAPLRPELSRVSVGIADYSITVECTGRFASVLSLVNQLSSSVALQRIVAANRDGRTRYHVALAVFESNVTPAVGVAAGEATRHD